MKKTILSVFLALTLLISTNLSIKISASAITTRNSLAFCRVIPQCLGVNWHDSKQYEDDFRKMSLAGFRLVRTDLFWRWVEYKKGHYDFTNFDARFMAMRRYGLRPLFILDYDNPFYLPMTTAAGQDAFVNFARAAAIHYKGYPIIWELWNEANTQLYWPPAPDPVQYMSLAHKVEAALRTIDPAAIIIGPALLVKQPPTDSKVQMTSLGFIEPCFQLGFPQLFDGLSIHPYQGGIPEKALFDYNQVHHFLNSIGLAGYNLLNSEWGYSSSNDISDTLQADYLERSFLISLSENVAFNIWYDWQDVSGQPKVGDHFGIVDSQGNPKEIFQRMQKFTKTLSGYSFLQRVASNPDDYILILKENLVSNKFKIAAWTTAAPHIVSIAMLNQKIPLSSTPIFLNQV